MVNINMSRNIKKRSGSKKTKKSWRKTDIRDVEDFLEDQRLEERLGGPLADKKDEDLFIVDTGADTGVSHDVDTSFQPHSKVADPISKSNRAEERKRERLARLKLRLQNRLNALGLRKNVPQRGDFSKDFRVKEKFSGLDTGTNSRSLRGKQVKEIKEKKELSETPRCFQIFQSHSKVADPISKRNRVRTAEERKHPILRKREEERKRLGLLKLKEKEAIQNRLNARRLRENVPQRGDFSKDLWVEGSPSVSEKFSDWVAPSVKTYNLSKIGINVKTVPKTITAKPNVIPCIEPPHPGMSYNPALTDHLELLKTVADKEQTLLKEEEHIRRVTLKMFRKLPREEAEKQWMKEMSEGVPSLDPEAATVDTFDDDDAEYHAINPPTDRGKKKDLKARRKAREERSKAAQRAQAKLERKKVTDIHRLQNLQDAVRKGEQKTDERIKKRILKQLERPYTTRRLGRNKYRERDLEFNLGSELKGCLRGIKPEGSILIDRFASLQKRNIMEVEAPQTRSKAKVKRFIKASHQVNWQVQSMKTKGRKNVIKH